MEDITLLLKTPGQGENSPHLPPFPSVHQLPNTRFICEYKCHFLLVNRLCAFQQILSNLIGIRQLASYVSQHSDWALMGVLMGIVHMWELFGIKAFQVLLFQYFTYNPFNCQSVTMASFETAKSTFANNGYLGKFKERS